MSLTSRAQPAMLPKRIADAATALPDPDDPDFGAAFDNLAGARVVLLGESSHGTSEFYRARAAITRHLVERHGFTIVALEADWPDGARVDAWVRGRARRPSDREPPFQRFPTWMWRNREFGELVRWLRAHNARLDDPDLKAGVFGLDLYSLSASIAAVLDYLDRVDPAAAREARRRYACFEPWQRRPEVYGHAAEVAGHGRCEDEVVRVLRGLLEERLPYVRQDGADWFDATQNARVVAAAERYYRSMYRVDESSWNLRDGHMVDTLDALLAARPRARAVVWARNSHIGDARQTRVAEWGQINVGQLCRERYGELARLVGFGTHTGTVAAASDWGQPMQIKRVLPSRDDSVERPFHDSGVPRLALDLRTVRGTDLGAALDEPRLERFIGVIYRPETERGSHYYEARLARQFDHYVFFDQTTAVEALPEAPRPGEAETYPYGL